MHSVVEFIARHGNAVVFAAVLAEQLGLPVPAALVLLATGAAIGAGQIAAGPAVAVSLAAALLGDIVWYELGARRGRSVLATLCRLSLEPDTCVRNTENMYSKYGVTAIVFSKFVPGLSTVAPPLAGVVGIERWRFLMLDAFGALAWTGAYIGAGWLFRSEIEWLADVASQTTRSSLTLALLIVAGYVAYKYVMRRRLYRELRVARITAEQVHARMQANQAPVIIDLRNEREWDEGAVPGALRLRPHEIESVITGLAGTREVVLYCS